LDQETRVGEAQFDEYRRKLERKLADAARYERRMGAVTFGMAAVALLGIWYLLLSPSAVDPLQRLFNLLPDPVGTIIGIALWVCYMTCAICVIPFLLLYFLQYKRKLQQAQQEQILAILAGLQRQIAELRKQEPPVEK
jgi:hypothetical protein